MTEVHGGICEQACVFPDETLFMAAMVPQPASLGHGSENLKEKAWPALPPTHEEHRWPRGACQTLPIPAVRLGASRCRCGEGLGCRRKNALQCAPAGIRRDKPAQLVRRPPTADQTQLIVRKNGCGSHHWPDYPLAWYSWRAVVVAALVVKAAVRFNTDSRMPIDEVLR